MTFKAELKFNDSSFKYTVIECDYSFSQEIDITHKPSAKPKAGTINIVVETKMDPDMIQWMLSTGSVRSGEITFFKDDATQKKLKTLNFKEAICINLREKFDFSSEIPMLTYISFVAKEITLDDVKYKAEWTNF
jgi:hypothetical protein